MTSVYDFSARAIDGTDVSLDRFRGQALLIVNTASKCGFTGQYDGLEKLHRAFADQPFEVLGFPCNQFGEQEPGKAAEIAAFCATSFDVTFPLFDKVEVNGPQTHPVFQWLKARLPGWFGAKVRWNFTKFLVGRDGQPIKRFAPVTKPERIESAIRSALGLR